MDAVAPFRLLAFARLRSTNDHAKALIRRGQIDAPTIILTQNQTAGRGRGKNQWWSGPGCLTVTFILQSQAHLPLEHISLRAGVAIRQALADLTRNLDILLKWPNDLLWQGRKLAGILCERERDFDLIGIGLNVAPRRVPRSIKDQIASLREITGHSYDITDVLPHLTRRILKCLGAAKRRTSFVEIIREYDHHHALLGRNVHVWIEEDQPPITGRCEGLDDSGRLLVRSGRQLHRIIAGTVRLAGEDRE
jgi:BirA family transcriptional regulator, biotin operon repressor / biotin---[acetyl-CoA-carboxylase] ligase